MSISQGNTPHGGSNSHPRFSNSFLAQWLEHPAGTPEGDTTRRLALAVMREGVPSRPVQAFGYSRQDWECEQNGRKVTLTFQNFARRDGTDPMQFAAYTLTLEGNNRKLHVSQERGFVYGTAIEKLQPKAEFSVEQSTALRRVERLLKQRTPKQKAASAVPA